MNCQTVVDSNKHFFNLYLGMPGSTNDARILRRSSLYHLALRNNFFDARFAADGFSPYLLGDSGMYSLYKEPNPPKIRTSSECLGKKNLNVT
jgi:hypothetical protein